MNEKQKMEEQTMAKTGIEYAVFGLLQEDGTYKNGKYLSPVTNFNGTPTKASVKIGRAHV